MDHTMSASKAQFDQDKRIAQLLIELVAREGLTDILAFFPSVALKTIRSEAESLLATRNGIAKAEGLGSAVEFELFNS